MRTEFHSLNPAFMDDPVEVVVVGAGGNGAQMVNALGRLHLALIALGREDGLGHVYVFDDDEVSDANIGRQLWSPSDIGRNKASTVVHRLNAYLGLGWDAIPSRFDLDQAEQLQRNVARILVGCVDSRAARRMLHTCVTATRAFDYYLDLGNESHTGQVVLGEAPSSRTYTAEQPRLPLVAELFPELLDKTVKEAQVNSCSRRISLENQGLFVNDIAVRCAAQLLYMLFTRARLTSHGAMFDIDAYRMTPIEVKRSTWARFGYEPEWTVPEKTRLRAA